MAWESEITPENIRTALREGIIFVTFTKLDGTERTIKCSLNQAYIPLEKMPKTTDNQRSDSDNTIAVWDIENEGWRSFRTDKVIKIDKYE